MDLQTLWFILITVLFGGFFLLEGFDYGVGRCFPLFAKRDGERRTVINAIGPVWDGNEVWLLTAGGAMFALSPTGMPPCQRLLPGAVPDPAGADRAWRGFEFRSKDDNPKWRRTWDAAIFIGSALPALLWAWRWRTLCTALPLTARCTSWAASSIC